MPSRLHSALLCLFLLASHLIEGNVAAAVPCAGDSPGVLTPSAAVAQVSSAPRSAQIDDSSLAAEHCPFCSAGGCQIAQLPVLAQAFTEVGVSTRPPCIADALPTDAFRLQADRILRPPK
jgi:hypothetical protein